ncbi:MAG: hypothetical protein QOE63_1855 [Acidimicrobiaceae bacterium]
MARAATSNRSAVRGAFDWLFRDRQTGKIVIAQRPNVPLALFLVAAGVRWLVHPSGTVGTIVSAVAGGALVWWGADELLRGVNPFRRLLGGAVLAATVVGFVAR